MFTRHPLDRERAEIPSTERFAGVDETFVLKVPLALQRLLSATKEALAAGGGKPKI